MSGHDDKSVPPTRAVEDNYPAYPNDTYGYVYQAADVVGQQAMRLHDELLHATADQLEAVELDDLDDYQTWAVARAWRRLGADDRFVSVCRRLMESDQQHPVIAYEEISRWVARHWANTGHIDRARRWIDDHVARWSDDLQARQLRGVLAVVSDPDGERDILSTLADEYARDAELRVDIAEDLWHFDQPRAARNWLDDARRAADQSDNRTVQVDIDLLAARITQ